MSERLHHLVLLGDSVFDNGSYVGQGNPSVIEQLQIEAEQRRWKASSVATDGNILSDIPKQLDRIPNDATHLFISIGRLIYPFHAMDRSICRWKQRAVLHVFP